MKFAETLETGKIERFGILDSVIETQLSKLFFFGETVLKVYKHGKYFFADLEEIASRRKFFEEDFAWNAIASPNIYLDLCGVQRGSFENVNVSEADDFYIRMQKIDSKRTLTELLQKREISVDEMRQITKALVDLIHTLSQKKLGEYQHLTDLGWKRLWLDDLVANLGPWINMAQPHISKGDAERAVSILETASQGEPYIEGYNESLLSIFVENNCDNLLLLEGIPSFIDIYPPKEEWRVADEFSTLVRTAVDAYVLGGPEYGHAVYETYRIYRADPPQRVKHLYEARAALIQWPYRHMLGQHDLAEKYRAFLMPILEELKNSN